MKRKNSLYELSNKAKNESKIKRIRSTSMLTAKTSTTNTTSTTTSSSTNSYINTDQHIQGLCHSITCLGISDEFNRIDNYETNNIEENIQMYTNEEIIENLVMSRADIDQFVQTLENMLQIILTLLSFLRKWN